MHDIIEVHDDLPRNFHFAILLDANVAVFHFDSVYYSFLGTLYYAEIILYTSDSWILFYLFLSTLFSAYHQRSRLEL